MFDQFRVLAERDAAHFRAIGNITSMLGELKVASRGDRAFVEELFTSAPDSVDRKTVAVAVLCVAIGTVHVADRGTQTALLLAVICILLCPARQRRVTLVHDIAYTEANAVTLFDALGRRLVLPIELCTTYSSFHATIVVLFFGSPGQYFVETHAYDVTDLSTADLLTPENWSVVVRSGVKVEMSIVVQQVSSDRELIQCPCCVGPAFEPKHRAGMLCTGCVRTFEVTTRGRFSSALAVVSDITRDSDDYAESVNDCGYMYTGTVLEVPGVQPYVGHLWGLMSGEQTSTQDGRLVVHSGPWQAQIRAFKRIRVLCDDTVPHISFRDQRSALHLAAGNGQVNVVAELLDRGADVDARDRLGHTALHYAAHRVQVAVMLLLLDRGASIDATPAVNYLTPLACVVWRRHRAAARLLLALGAIITAPHTSRVAVFYAAASVGDVATAQAMIRLGVDVNSIDDLGKSALHRAAGGGNYKMVETLLEYGVNVNARSWRGNTPLALAMRGGFVEVVRLLLEAGARMDTMPPSLFLNM
ncbi:unnamed protein product [Peniophora sp. CBMAI 1063]|nr:unnamed protein product [Peniophora sp. CBMAI 1063]